MVPFTGTVVHSVGVQAIKGATLTCYSPFAFCAYSMSAYLFVKGLPSFNAGNLLYYLVIWLCTFYKSLPFDEQLSMRVKTVAS